MKLYASFVILAACGSGGTHANPDGQVDSKPIDARVFLDAPPVVPQTITLSGTATEDTQSGSNPLAGVTVALYKTSDETTPIVSTTSGATGAYTFDVPTDGVVVDAFIKATLAGYTDNYVYPVAPFKADTSTDLNLVSSADFTFLGIIGGQTSGDGFIVVEIQTAAGDAIQGATVLTAPASGLYRYTANGVPTGKISTDTDGAGFCFSVPPGEVTVNAAMTGASFKSHVINAHPNAFTNTVVTE